MLLLLQYCSPFVCSESVPRINMLWRTLGCEDLQYFFESRLDIVERMGDRMLLVAGWMFRRHFLELVCFPLKLSVIGDPSAAMPLKESIAVEFFQAKLCDLDEFF